jgi:hypothetical protein
MMAIFRKQGFIAGKFGAFFERVMGVFWLEKNSSWLHRELC